MSRDLSTFSSVTVCVVLNLDLHLVQRAVLPWCNPWQFLSGPSPPHPFRFGRQVLLDVKNPLPSASGHTSCLIPSYPFLCPPPPQLFNHLRRLRCRILHLTYVKNFYPAILDPSFVVDDVLPCLIPPSSWSDEQFCSGVIRGGSSFTHLPSVPLALVLKSFENHSSTLAFEIRLHFPPIRRSRSL